MPRKDGDDGAFPAKGKEKQRKQQIGEANPNSRAAIWLREAAAKPAKTRPEQDEVLSEPLEEVGEADPFDDLSTAGTVGQFLDSVFEELTEYVARLENTLRKIYRENQTMKKQIVDLTAKVEDFDSIKRDLGVLQTIVSAIQNSQRWSNFNFSASNGNPAPTPTYTSPNTSGSFNPNVVTPTITSDEDYPQPPPRMKTDGMDKE